jgi:tripartite-type tricarboxylate transporter receptor subunit TctC
LSGEAVKALEGSEVKERLISQGIEPVGGGAEEFAKYLSAEISKWARVVKEAGIPPQ